MGLTVHYQFSYKGDEEQLLAKLKWLSTEFLKLPVSKVHDISGDARGYEFSVEVGPGCEWFTIALGRIESGEWRGHGFTKTAFAADLKLSHAAVIAMLDLCREVGILESVNDESTYWETRDTSVL
jgi:hypothetical protein